MAKNHKCKIDIQYITAKTEINAEHKSIEAALKHVMILYKIKHGSDALLEAIATNYDKLTQE